MRLRISAPTPEPDLTNPWSIEVDDDLVARWDGLVTAGMTPHEVVSTTLFVMGQDYDSLDREALFTRACDRFGFDYEVLYQAWLHPEDPKGPTP